MIEVTFYRNGFEINGHAHPEICYQVSIFAWAMSNVILNIDSDGEFYTADYDNSNAGYTHFIFNSDNEQARKTVHLTKKMLYTWASHYKWETDKHVQIIEKDEMLIVPPNFKVLKGIVTTEQPSPQGGGRQRLPEYRAYSASQINEEDGQYDNIQK